MFGPTFDHVKTEAKLIHKIFNVIALATLLSGVLLLIVYWSKLPDTVPIHFNIKGEADGWGSKYTLIILPIIAVGFYAFLTMMESKPHFFNFPVKITEQNAQQQFDLARDLLNVSKNLSTILLAVIAIFTVFDARETPIPYSNTIIFVLIGLLIAITIFYFIRSIKLK